MSLSFSSTVSASTPRLPLSLLLHRGRVSYRHTHGMEHDTVRCGVCIYMCVCVCACLCAATGDCETRQEYVYRRIDLRDRSPRYIPLRERESTRSSSSELDPSLPVTERESCPEEAPRWHLYLSLAVSFAASHRASYASYRIGPSRVGSPALIDFDSFVTRFAIRAREFAEERLTIVKLCARATSF